MIAHKKEFAGGAAMMVGFWIVFALLLSPLYPGAKPGTQVNMLDYMDNMYNSISKNSSNYIQATREKAEKIKGGNIELSIKADDKLPAERLTKLFQQAGATVTAGEKEVKISGDLTTIINAVLADADAMFKNDGTALTTKYGYAEKQVMYDWWNSLKSMEKSLTKQEKFKESNILYQTRTKAVEPAYNYYGIEAKSISEKAMLVVASLAGYVVYTMWFGFAILFMFEGWGLKLEH